ncbi:transposase [bacterium]|nr:transposase [bacterium]
MIIQSLKYCQKNKSLYILGYIIMPMHIHMITSNRESISPSSIMCDFNHHTSTQIIQLLEKKIQAF